MQEAAGSASPPPVMSPYISSSKYNSPISSSRSPSPSLPDSAIRHHHHHHLHNHHHRTPEQSTKYLSDDEISVGCPSPAAAPPASPKSPSTNSTSPSSPIDSDCTSPQQHHPQSEDYFKPLKKLKMVHLAGSAQDLAASPPSLDDRTDSGVKSFSIEDILNHKPSKSPSTVTANASAAPNGKIVRPWDLDPSQLDVQAHHLHHHHLERFHRHLKAHQHHQQHHQQALALFQHHAAAAAAANFATSLGAAAAFAGAANPSGYALSETGSDRSSSVTSDCCSPDIVTAPGGAATPGHRQKGLGAGVGTPGATNGAVGGGGKQPSGTPLDALFQMTSKTFDSSTGESSAGKYNHFHYLYQNLRNVMYMKLI